MDLLNSYTRNDLSQADKAIEIKEKLALLAALKQNKERRVKKWLF
ncbi:MAG: hypothetical protein ABL880_00055 [Methylotenera sp.]